MCYACSFINCNFVPLSDLNYACSLSYAVTYNSLRSALHDCVLSTTDLVMDVSEAFITGPFDGTAFHPVS
jgi:hypothetical protein